MRTSPLRHSGVDHTVLPANTPHLKQMIQKWLQHENCVCVSVKFYIYTLNRYSWLWTSTQENTWEVTIGGLTLLCCASAFAISSKLPIESAGKDLCLLYARHVGDMTKRMKREDGRKLKRDSNTRRESHARSVWWLITVCGAVFNSVA